MSSELTIAPERTLRFHVSILYIRGPTLVWNFKALSELPTVGLILIKCSRHIAPYNRLYIYDKTRKFYGYCSILDNLGRVI